MAEYGLSQKGFTRKPYTAIEADKMERARDLFGEDIDLSERSPLGLYIRADAWEESKLWDEMEHVYYSAFIDDAEGKQLDGLIKYIGLFRFPALHSRGVIEITGRVGKVVTKGTKVTTAGGVQFRTRKTIMLDENGFGVVDVEAVEPGWIGNVPPRLIDRVFNPTGEISNITNPERTSGGMPIETDEDLRERYYRSLSRKGKATRAAIEAAILELPTVKDAVVLENDTMEADEFGLPPKCIAPFVFDGKPEEIVSAVLATKSAGIKSHGEIYLEAFDSRDHPHLIGFTKAKETTVYVDITLIRNTSFRPGYENSLRTNVISYIGGLDTNGVEFNGLGLGQDVVHSRIITITHDRGITDAVVKISLDGENWQENNIKIPFMEIAFTDYTKVVVR